MKIGVALPHYGDDVSVDDVISIAQECERLGFDSVWVSDHLTFDLAKYGGSPDPIGSLEPLATLAAIARETTSVRLGTMVLCNEFRHPVVLAKQASQIDRLELGIGAGWYEPEFSGAGIAFPRPGVRLERLGEAVQILRSAFKGEPVDFEGKHYTVQGIAIRPRPVLPPTIWVGGKGDRAMRLIASLGEGYGLSGWNAAWFQDADAYAERARLLGNAPVRRSIGQYAQGSAQEMVDRLGTFADLAVEHAVMCFSKVPFGLDDREDLTRFAQDVLPHVRD